MERVNEIDMNSLSFGILCNFQFFCGEERALEAYKMFSSVKKEIMAYRALGSLDHLRELVQAEKNGRLVELPAVLGTPVYAVNPPIKGIAATVICTHFDYGLVPYWNKNVFATREEAEAALKGGASDA